MNILYLADPNSIHDIRWLNFLCKHKNHRGFVIARSLHYETYLKGHSSLDKSIPVLASVVDPSTSRPWRNLWQAIKIRRLIKRYQIDILHIIYAEPNALWAMFKPLFDVPIIVTTHGTDILKTIPEFFKRSTLLSSLVANQYRTAFNRVDHFTCTSRRQMEILCSLRIYRPVSVIRTGVDLQLVKSSNLDVAASMGIKKPFVLMPRNMRPIYNHEFTLDAIAFLSQSIRERFCFVFVNADTPDRDYFRKVQQRAGMIEATIHFCPSLTNQELVSLSKQASLILMNPSSDGSPVTAMEAMACQVPLILPPLKYDREIFGGIPSFDGWRPEALRDSIEKLLRDSASQQSLQRFASTVEKEGNMETEMNKLARIYDEVL